MEKKTYYLGIDVGSVSTNLVAADEKGLVAQKLYLRTGGQPVKVMQEGLGIMSRRLGNDVNIGGVGATGSGRQLANIIIGADIVKNEITAHATASGRAVPGVRTILEIGGQDSKIIFLKSGIVHDFAMNTVCAAGTGSFLDRQAARLNIPIDEFGKYALMAKTPVRIAGRCAVFAESELIGRMSEGINIKSLAAGVNYSLFKRVKPLLDRVKGDCLVVTGGVAGNRAFIKYAKEEMGYKEVIVPKYNQLNGAIGCCVYSKK